MTVTIERRGQLSPEEVRRVFRLVDAVTDTDGVRPLSEHVMLHLRYGGDEPGRNLLLHTDGELIGYAFLDTTDEVEGSSAELAVSPSHRHAALARELVETLVAETPDGRLRLWAHGRNAAASSLARELGFQRERVLWQMRRSLFAPLPAPEFPPGVTLRTFVVGADEDAWIGVNNRAFAAHPDQGHWTLEDLCQRENEPWFDPAGFFLAERDARLIGFHWTKVHGASGDQPSQRSGDHGHDPIGEVYVVGVDPDAQGQHLGPALTLVGLAHLRAKGLTQAMLYVDESNAAAIRVYTSLGFTRWDVDVSYRRG
jgi:mycothiol synthase